MCVTEGPRTHQDLRRSHRQIIMVFMLRGKGPSLGQATLGRLCRWAYAQTLCLIDQTLEVQ